MLQKWQVLGCRHLLVLILSWFQTIAKHLVLPPQSVVNVCVGYILPWQWYT